MELPPSQRPDTLPLPAPSDLDLTLGAAIPGEDEAWSSYQSLQKARRENTPMDPSAVQTWTQYRDTAKKYNRPIFPSQTQQHRQTVADYSDKLLAGLDQIPNALSPEQAQQVNARLLAFPEPERPAELARTANYALLSTANGQKIKPEAYEAYRTLYAKQVLKLDDTSDLAVYNELKRRNDEKKDADANLAADFEILGAQALAGKPIDIEAHAKKYAEYFSPPIAEAATLELRNRVKQAKALGKSVQPIAEALKSYILIEASREDAIDPNDPNRDKAALPPITLGEASSRFAALTDDQKAAVTIYLGQSLQDLPTDPDGTLKRTFEKFGQTAVDSGRAALNFINRATMPTDEASAKNFQDWLSSSSFLKGKAQKIASITKPSDGWTTHIALATAEQLPYMLAASSGLVGGTINGLAMAGQSYEQARLRNPEGNDTAQFLASGASGATQAVIETAAMNVVGRSLGALPILKNTFGAKFGTESFLKLAKITNPLTRAAVGTAAGALAVGGTEYAEEITQDLTDRTIQDLASIATGVTDDYGNPSTIAQNLKTVASSWSPATEKGAKLMLSLIPFIIIGGGGGGFASFNNGISLKQNAAAMHLLGVPEPIIAEIVNTPDVSRAETLLRQAITTEIQVVKKQKANEYAENLLAHAEIIQAAWESQGVQILEPQFDEAGTVVGVSLSLPDKGVQFFDTEQAAQEALVKWSMETQENLLDGGIDAYTADTVDFMTAEGQRAGEVDTTVQQRDFTGTFENLILEGLATMEQLQSRLAAFAMQEGISLTEALAMAQSGALRIRARNFSETVGKRGTRYVIELFKGADPMNAREDFAEAYWKAGLTEGLFTAETALGWIRDMEKSTGNPYLDQSFQYTPGGDNLLFWEALGQASNEYALHHYRHPSVSPKFKQWVEMMLTALGTAWNWFKTMTRGATLQGVIEKGQLNKQFVRYLQDSVGLNEQARETRIEQREQQNAMAEWLDQFPKLTDRIKGRLLHPARAVAMNSPEAGELKRIYDGLTTTKRKIGRNGRPQYRDYVIKAEAFFADRTETVKLDELRASLNDEGFQFESTSEMLEAVEDALFYGRESYATQSAGTTSNDQSFSLTPSTTSTQSIPSTLDVPVQNKKGDTVSSISLPSALSNEALSVDNVDPSADPSPIALIAAHDREVAKRMSAFAALLDERDEQAKNASKTFVGKVWLAYAQNDEIFQYGRTTSKDAEEIAAAVSTPGKLVTANDATDTIRFVGPNGTLDIMDADTKRPYIRSSNANSRGKKEGGGSQLYAAALDWIHNNGKTIKDDPAGITGINMTRRTSNFLASAIRWGTTIHLKPHKDQNVGKWSKLPTANIALLATKEMDNVHKVIPESKGLTYDFATDKFLSDDQPVTAENLQKIIEDNKAFDKGIGLSTLQRAIITASAIQEFQRGATLDLIPQATPDNLVGVSYSLSRDTQHNLQTIIEARMSRGPEERIAIMTTMRDRLQSLAFKLESRESGDLTPMEKQLQGWRGKDLTEAQKERLRIEDALATVKGILSALPMEIRAKVQVPFTRILDADTERTTVNAFRELIANADEVIEKDLQETYVERITDLLDRARATSDEKRTNKTLLTPETQRIIDQIDAIVEMDQLALFGAETKAEADLHALQAQIDQSDDEQLRRELTQKQIQILEYQRDLQTFGMIGDQSAAELSKTYAAIKEVYVKGRYTRKILDDEARYNLHANRTEIKHILGFPEGVSGPAHDRATNATTGKSFKNFLKGLTLDHFSFHQVLELLFPNSITAQEWSNKAIAAMRATKKRRIDANTRFEEFMAARLGARTQRARAQIIGELSERKARKAAVAEALKTKTEKIPIDRVPALLSGENKVSWSDNPHAIAQLTAAWREFRLLPAKTQKRREFLTVQLITARRPAEGLLMSDLELLDVLQTYAQESYAASMDKYGYTPEVIAQIKQEIDPRALAIGEFLRAEYDNGWKEMNPVYQRLFHMDMPQHRNYAPGTFANISMGNQEVNGSPLGQAGNANAMSAGATKNRRSHVSRPLTKSALSKYFAHVEQTSYWIEWAELVKEISATVRPPEVRRAIEARHGKQAAAAVDQWINYLNTDGADNARGILLAHETIIERVMTTQSNMSLAWNFSVPFKQFSAALGSMTMENPREALKSWTRIVTQWPTLKTIFQSDAIQQRIQEGFSPETKTLLDSTKQNPSRLIALLYAGHLPASMTDAVMTTISAFISYDIAYRRALAQKNNPEQAHLAAMQRMDRVVALTAQPNETQLKSLIELRNSRGIGRLFTMFRSDPRRAIASVMASAWKLKRGDTTVEQFATVVITQWLLYGALGALGTAIFKSITQDEDDDTDYWSSKHFILGSLLGPVEGFNFIGSVIAYTIRSLAGEKPYLSLANPLEAQISRLTRLNFDEFAKDPFDTTNIIAQALAMASSVAGHPEAALLPAALRIADQVAQGIDKHTETTSEKLNRLANEFATIQQAQTAATTADIDAAVAQALALPPEQQAQALANLDEPAKAKAREKINKAKAQANMTDLELKLARMSKTRRAEAIQYILNNLPDSEKEPFQIRTDLLFPEK